MTIGQWQNLPFRTSIKVVFPRTSRSNLKFQRIQKHSETSGRLAPIARLALTFAALLMYLIVYKMKHFVLYIVNLLHSVS